MTGEDDVDFNEVFFTDVRVPAENLIGELNKGWAVANGSLGHERTMLWISYAERLDDLIRDAPSDASGTRPLQMDLQALRLLGYQQLSGGTPTRPRSRCSSCSARRPCSGATWHALEEHGQEGLVHPALTAPYNHMDHDVFSASWFERYARSFPGTIAGGTSEIHRNIIAERILGLPR